MHQTFPKLNLPEANLNFRNHKGRAEIWDIVRKKFISLTPEEWVRQHFLHFLCNEKKYPKSLIRIESRIGKGRTKIRADLRVFDRNNHPLLIVECKSSSTKITTDSLNQIKAYHKVERTPYVALTNGLTHLYLEISDSLQAYPVKQLPIWSDLKDSIFI